MSKFDISPTPNPTPENEKLAACALRYNGQIFTGQSHYEAITELEKALPVDIFKEIDMRNVEEGFITNTGRYLSRDEMQRITDSKTRKAIEDFLS